MKNNSVNIAPNGNTPDIALITKVLIYQGLLTCEGRGRGIAFTLHGKAIGSDRVAKTAPAKTRGAETPSQRNIIASRDERGTAATLPFNHKRQFKNKNIPKATPGSPRAVMKTTALDISLLPPSWTENVLRNLVATQPPIPPLNENKISEAESTVPLMAGERNPTAAKMMTIDATAAKWEPVPIQAHSQRRFEGDLNTSPCSIFHPDSSSISRVLARASYLAKSCATALLSNIASIPAKRRATATELTIANQWTSPDPGGSDK